MTDHVSIRTARVVGYARLLVPVVAVVLVAFALNASWHAMQGTLRQLGAPGELVVALPVVLEPAALIYAWVTIDRRRTGRDITGVRRLLAAALTIAVAYNIASALPLDVLVPAGSVGRMIVLAVSAALAPLTVVSVGHTALEEYAAWRASRRSLVDDVHAALEAEAQEALTGRLRAEFAPEVHAAVLDRLRAEMTARLGIAEQSAEQTTAGEQDCSPALGGGEQPRPLTAGSVGDDGPPRAVSVLWERIAVEVAQLGCPPHAADDRGPARCVPRVGATRDRGAPRRLEPNDQHRRRVRQRQPSAGSRRLSGRSRPKHPPASAGVCSWTAALTSALSRGMP